MSVTSVYSHTYGDHDDSRNPVSSRDVEADGFGQGSENSATRRHVMVVILVSYAALREATQERERQRAVARARPAHKEVVGGGRGGGLAGCVVHLSSWDPLYIVGRGCTLTPPPRHQEATAKEEEKCGDGQGWGQAGPPENPNPGRPGPGLWCPPFFLYSLMGFFQ
jgi:hypothetical protein